jgi:thiopeptide-type bacteriocin biosynthesis protein
MSPASKKTSTGAAGSRRALYKPLDWVMVRVPLLPIEAYLALGNRQTETPCSSKSHRLRLPSDARARAALAVGSGNLFDALEQEGRAEEREPGLGGKLLRYQIRMSTRPTPYGLFAGVALARWGVGTDLTLADSPARTRTRPDMAWLLRQVLELEARREVRAHLHYLTNARAFLHAGRVFLPDPAPMADGAGSRPSVSLRATRVVCRALALARTPISHRRLVAELATSPGATVDKVEGLIDQLWHQTLLLTDLRPPLTESSPATYVIGRLRDIPAAADIRKQLENVLSEMAEFDQLPMEQRARGYRRLAALKGTEAAAPEPAAQVDMALPLAGTHIATAVGREAARAAELILRLTPLPDGLPYLAAYRRAFEARYGLEREVLLLELLDPNFGLGPPSTRSHGSATASDPRKAALRQQCLYDLALTALRERRLIIELDAEALDRLESWSPSPHAAPYSMDLSLFVMAETAADLDAGRFQVVVGPNVGAIGAGRNLGRFVELLGDDAQSLLQQVTEAEPQDDRIRAELVYLPHRFRSANVAIRPHRHAYEIALGTTPSVSPDRVIPVDQLVIGVRDGRFYVRWPQRGAEVVACAGHMLNNMQAPDVFRFLEDVRRDGQPQLSFFDWGSASGLPLLPRVQVGRIVLSPAQWRVDARTRSELAVDSFASYRDALRRWRSDWQVPRYVYLSAGDNRLLLDLENDAQADELRAEVRRLSESSRLFLQESLPGPEHAWVAGPGGRFLIELVVPMALQPQNLRAEAAASAPCPVVAAADRLRPPGSDWLFAKLYSPRAFEDDLLIGPVAEICQHSLVTGLADDWFFIRYADPDTHLRLRFRGRPQRLMQDLLPQLCEWTKKLLDEGLGTRLCFDTYEREVERYGGAAGMEAAEAVFGADSRAVVEILRLCRKGLVELDMTNVAALSIDRLLAALGLNEPERIAWCRNQAMASKLAGGQEFRQRKDKLRQLLGDPEYTRARRGGDALERVLLARSGELLAIHRRLDALQRDGVLSQSREAMLRSHVHLHCNRLLATDWSEEDQIVGLVGRTRLSLDQAPLTQAARIDHST